VVFFYYKMLKLVTLIAYTIHLMFRIIKRIALAFFLILLVTAQPLIAQVKKTPVKPKPKPAAVQIPVLTRLDPFAKTPDDLVEFLNDEFKKLNLTLKDIDETTTHFFEGTKQLKKVSATSRELTFTNSVSSTIEIDADDKVTQLWIQADGMDTVRFKAISNMLAYNAWPVYYKTEDHTSYKNGNIIASKGSDFTYNDDDEIESSYTYISIRKITPYTYQPGTPVVFNAKTLTINDNALDVGYGIVKLIEGLGYGLLYKDVQQPILNNNNKLTKYSTRYQFTNAISADIETTPFGKLKFIDIDSDDPISFLKIKRALDIAGWKKYNSDAETKTDFYEYNNRKCIVFGETKSIDFTVEPERSDVISRLQETEVPSLNELMDLYHSGTKEQVIATISDKYVNDFYITNNPKPMTFKPQGADFGQRFLIRTDEGKVPGEVTFTFGLELPDTIVAIWLASDDVAYVKRLCEEFKTSKYANKFECVFRIDNKGSIYGLYVQDIELNKQRNALKGIK